MKWTENLFTGIHYIGHWYKIILLVFPIGWCLLSLSHVFLLVWCCLQGLAKLEHSPWLGILIFRYNFVTRIWLDCNVVISILFVHNFGEWIASYVVEYLIILSTPWLNNDNIQRWANWKIRRARSCEQMTPKPASMNQTWANSDQKNSRTFGVQFQPVTIFIE
jgi:hypothetical protein